MGSALPFVPDLQTKEDIDKGGNEQLSAISTGSEIGPNADPVAAEVERIKELKAELNRLESMIAQKQSSADAERTRACSVSTKRKPSVRGRNASVQNKRRR